VALERAGERARGATAYVTLEPCAHHGQTGPCAEALAEAGIGRAVIAMEDPDPRVSGRGAGYLRAAGIPVVMGVGGAQAAEINAGFFSRLERGRPLVTLKVASSLDGRIAIASGESRWITGEEARARAHGLRAEHDAVLIGSGTAIADDPELTCRLPGLEDRSPIRVVVDRRLRLAVTAKLLAQPPGAAWIVTREGDNDRRRALAERGAVIISLSGAGPDTPAPGAVLKALGDRGLTRVLVEGGGTMAASLLRAGLVDRIAWFRSPSIIGGDGLPAVAGLDLSSLTDAPGFRRVAVETLGEDVLETLRR
jgi:diaminohydroxyphosphoribosylaminopyrimidine deaminase/5-amino-6-(5-phosphoribosylamino)uracil reductase